MILPNNLTINFKLFLLHIIHKPPFFHTTKVRHFFDMTKHFCDFFSKKYKKKGSVTTPFTKSTFSSTLYKAFSQLLYIDKTTYSIIDLFALRHCNDTIQLKISYYHLLLILNKTTFRLLY